MDESAVVERLRTFRERIDNLYAALIYILAERFRCTDEVGLRKAKHALSSKDQDREERQFARARSMAAGSGSNPQVIEDILRFVIQKVVGRHEKIANDHVAEE